MQDMFIRQLEILRKNHFIKASLGVRLEAEAVNIEDKLARPQHAPLLVLLRILCLEEITFEVIDLEGDFENLHVVALVKRHHRSHAAVILLHFLLLHPQPVPPSELLIADIWPPHLVVHTDMLETRL